MALYHAHANYISRSGGKSSIGHSAYITGEKAYENRTGITHSYLGKTKEVLYTNILLPEGAEHLDSSEKLWNYVEEFEDELANQRYGNYSDTEKQERSLAAKDKYLNSAATAFCLEVSLPKEFSAKEKIELSDLMAKEIFADKKLIVQYAIHDVENNPHVHFISNFRPVIDGKFNLQKYRFRKADIKEIRGQIADITNIYARERGYDFAIDHRSYAEQGIKLEPTKHLGWWASKLNDKSRIVLENQEILSKNTSYLLENPEELVKLLIKDKTVFTLDELQKSVQEHFKGDMQAWHVLKEYVLTKDVDPLFEKIETFGRFLEVASEIRDLVMLDADYLDIDNNQLIKELKAERQILASNIMDNVSDYHWLMSRVGMAEDTIFFMSDKTPLLWNDRAEFLGEGVPCALRSGNNLDSLAKICGKEGLNSELVDIFNLEYVKSAFKDKEYYIGSKDLQVEKDIVQAKSNLMASSFSQDSALRKLLGNTPEQNITSVIRVVEKQQGYGFSNEQKEAIISLIEPCCYSALVGKAGTGKTSVLRSVSASYRQAGYRIIGTSFQGAAVGELGSSLGESMDAGYTLSKLNKEWRLIDQNEKLPEQISEYELTNKTVVIVDEVGMAARSLLKPLLDRAQEKGSKVICVGDAGQIAAIDRGDISRILLEDANVLQEVHRQKDAGDIRASKNIAQGYIKEAVEHYSKNTQILETDFSAKLRLSCDYAEKVENSKSAMDHMIIAYKNSDVLDLNYKIQNNLKESGYLGKEFTILAGFNVADNEHKKSIDLEGYSYDKAKRFYDHLDKAGIYYEKFKQIMQPETFHIGDKIRFASNWNKGISGKEVYNGTLGIIKSYDEKNNIIEIIRDNGEITSVEAGKYQALTLGYAVTINRSQGKTVNNSYLYLSNSKGATIGAKEFYVATTRHKEKLHIYSSKEYLGTKSVDQKIAERHKLTGEDFVVNKDLLNEIQDLDQIKTKTYGLWNEMQQDVRSGKCDLWQHDKFSLYKEMKDTRSKLAFSVEQQWKQARLFAREINLEKSDLLRWQGKEERIVSDEDKLLSSYREARGKAKELWQENLTEGSPANSPKYVEYKDQADQRNELAYEIATFGATKEIYNRDGEVTESNRFNFTHASEWKEIVRNSNSFIQDNLQKAREEKSLSLEANEVKEEFAENLAEDLVIDKTDAQIKEQGHIDAASGYVKADQSDQQEIDQQNPYSLEKSSGLDEQLAPAEERRLDIDAGGQSVGHQLEIGSAESDIKEENNLHFTEENKDELDMTQQFDSGFEEGLVIDKTDAQIKEQDHIDVEKDYVKADQSDQQEVDQQNPYSLEKSSGLDEHLVRAEGEQLDADARGQSVGHQLEIGSAETDIKEENNLHFTEEHKDELDMIVKFNSGYDCKELENSLKDKGLDDQKSALKELKTGIFADYLQNKVDDFMDRKIEAKTREDLLEVLEKEHGFLQETMRDHINEMYDLGREYRELKHIIVENSKNKDLVDAFEKKLQVLDSTNNASMLQSTLDSVRTNSLAQVDNNLTKFVESIGNKTLKTIEQEKNIDLSDYYKNAPAIEKQQESVKSYQPVREKSTEYGKEESGRPDYMYEAYKVFSEENHASHENKDEEKELDIEVRKAMGEQIGRNNSEQYNTHLHFEKVEVFDRDGKLNKYHNKDMLGVLDACKHLDQLSKMPIAQQAQEQGIRDYEGELHKDVNSYLLSVGLNEKLAANIDPNSSIGQRMHELLEREHQYHIEKNVAVDQRSTYSITREIQENYTHLKEHHINARIDSDLQRTDFQGVSHHDPKQYLRSVILDSRVQSKIDFDDKSLGSTLEKEFGRAIEPDRSREMDRGMELSL